jgi:undecaprenyl-diphosphatase
MRHPPPWPRRIAGKMGQGIALLIRPPRVRVAPRWRAYSRLAVGALIAVIVIVAIMIFVDAWASASAVRAPRWIVEIFGVITDFGKSEWFLVPLGIMLVALAVFATPIRPRFAQLVLASVTVRLGFLFVAIALPSLFDTIVKRIIGRARPFVDRPPDPFHFVFGDWRAQYASLPSGHATTAFAAAIAIGLVCPRLRAAIWIYALLIALSRIVVVAHFPSDVAAGALVGIVGALLVRDWFAARRLGFTIRPDGSVLALPGPSPARIKRVAASLLAS